MKKLLFLCAISTSMLTISCIPVQLTEQEKEAFQDPVQIVVIYEEPVFISAPVQPIYRPISKQPVNQSNNSKSRKVNIETHRQTITQRPSTPAQPVRQVPKKQEGTAVAVKRLRKK